MSLDSNLNSDGSADRSSQRPKIWVDADACPVAIREILFRTINRLNLQLIFIANQSVNIPESKLVVSIVVPHGADLADHKIVDMMNEGDVVITSDIPLAARVVEQGGVAIGSRGELLDDKTVHSRLAARNLMDQLRSAGMTTGGPKPLSQKDIQTFANQLDRTITRALRKFS